jgi:hypothetical protein
VNLAGKQGVKVLVSAYRQAPDKKKSPAWGDRSNFFGFYKKIFEEFYVTS